MTLIGAREDEGRRSLRRWIAASAAAHAALVGILAWSPFPAARSELPAVVRVDLMARAPSPGPPSAAPPAPAPEAEPEPTAEPAPAPEPEPSPPEPAETVLPETPRQPPEREPEPEPAPEPEEEPPEPEPEPPPEAEAPEPETTPARDAPEEPPARERALAEDRRRREEGYEDVLADLRSEQEGEAGASAPAAREGPAGGPGVPVSAAERAWMRRAKVHVKRSWLLPAGLRGEPLEAEVKVEVGPGGEVLSAEIVRRSGNPFYDDFVERAVRKASPFPEPPEAAEWRFVFRPRELRE